MLSSGSLTVFSSFKSLIYFAYSFVHGMKIWVQAHCSSCRFSFAPLLIKKLVFPHCVFLAPLSRLTLHLQTSLYAVYFLLLYTMNTIIFGYCKFAIRIEIIKCEFWIL